MLIVILAAGRSRRFSEAGFTKPKCLLPAPDGTPLLSYQIDRLNGDNLLVVGRKEDKPSISTVLLLARMMPNAPRRFKSAWIDEQPGPLASLWAVKKYLDVPDNVFVAYCDVMPGLRTIGNFLSSAHNVDALQLALKTDNPRFTQIGDGLVDGGLFWFRTGHHLVELMSQGERGEFNGLPDIVRATKRHAYVLDSESVDLGVPSEYRMWMAREGAPIEEWKLIGSNS